MCGKDYHAEAVSRGANTYNAKFTWEQAEEIRALRGTAPALHVAKRYGVTHKTITNIWRGKSYVARDQSRIGTPDWYKEKILANIRVDENGCWIWTRTGVPDGYGTLAVQGRMRLVHRVAFEAWTGTPAGSLFVCHRCDVRRCCNPDHLFLGTNAENMADRDRKGRGNQTKGEAKNTAKLKNEDVLAIRASDVSTADLSLVYGVTTKTINDIRALRTWRHL